MKMEQTECSEMSAYKIQTLGNFPQENIQHTEHGKTLKSIIHIPCLFHCFDHIKIDIKNEVSDRQTQY
jgi:hypothetical protein